MPNIGPAEILVILVVALLVFGPDKLPDIGRQIGRATREFRRVQASLRDEVRDALDPPVSAAAPPTLPPGPAEPNADDALDEPETSAGDPPDEPRPPAD